MSSSTATQTRARQLQGPAKRGTRGRGGRRGGSRASQGKHDKPEPPPNTTPAEETSSVPEGTVKDTSDAQNTVAEVSDTAICWICAEPVKYYSVSACNHRTCHICALRLRALYKKLDCTFCKETQPMVIFTCSPDALFSSYRPDDIPHKDYKLSIYFETTDMMEETLVLLRFNCPDHDCDYTASGWGDLKLHVRAVHGKMLCELCLRFKKVFAHEHSLYPPNILPFHLPSMPHRSHKQVPKESIEGGVHPLCEFCRECFFSDDELYVHMRERHEECFICKQNEIRDQYFQNYASLEAHFAQAHFVCTNSTCQAQKFVVFGSALDLKAHQVEVHGAEMSSRDKRDARRVQTEFAFDDAGSSSRRNRFTREREQEPPPALNRPPVRPAGSRREAFGGRLTGEVGATGCPAPPSGTLVPSTPPEDTDPVISDRYASLLSRLHAIAPNPTNALPAIKAAIRGYHMNELTARDIISTIWNILDNNLDDTASIINGVVDLLDDEEQKTNLLASWNGFKVEQRQHFPELVPTSVGTAYAGVASGRVISAKNTIARSSKQSSRQVWDRVAQAAGSSSRTVPGALPRWSSSSQTADRFPPLPSLSTSPRPLPPQRNTPRVPGPSTSSFLVSSASTTKVPTTQRKPPPTLTSAAFPELPSSTTARMKPPVGGNQSLRNIRGDSVPTGSAWTNDRHSTAGETAPGLLGEQMQTLTNSEEVGGKGRKGKGKQKQTLFVLGAFPT
ncbi:hypothetical protein V8B97DRAFT_1875710 [Scleroderma yunnanense]